MQRDQFISEMVAWLNRSLVAPDVQVSADTQLFESRIIDSIAILKLIAWTERALGRVIPDDQIRMDRFQSVEAIANAFIGGDTWESMPRTCSKHCAAAAICGSRCPASTA